MSKVIFSPKNRISERILIRFVKEDWNAETYYVSDFSGVSLEAVSVSLNEFRYSRMAEQFMEVTNACKERT